MTRRLIILLVSILPPSSLNAQSSCRVHTTAVVRDSSVGPLRLGMPFSEVFKRCQVIKDTIIVNHDFVELERVLVVNLGLDRVTVAGSIDPLDPNQAAQRIASIYVDRPILSTEDSLRVGMTLRQLRRRYKGLSGGVSEASTWLSIPGHCGIGFAISNSGPFGHGTDMDWQALRQVPDSTKVVRIEVNGCAS